MVPKLLLRDFITFCPLNHSRFKFFKIDFFPVYGTSIISSASRCVVTLRYKNVHLALNSFIWWCGGWTGSRAIPYVGHGRSGSYSQSLQWISLARQRQSLCSGLGAQIVIWGPECLISCTSKNCIKTSPSVSGLLHGGMGRKGTTSTHLGFQIIYIFFWIFLSTRSLFPCCSALQWFLQEDTRSVSTL